MAANRYILLQRTELGEPRREEDWGKGNVAIAAAAPVVQGRTARELTDQELVAAVRAGDDRAFEQLYSRYQRRIAAYIYGMVQDHGRAEDVAQDVFMSALRRMRETDRPIAFKPWLYEIAKNACIDQFRRSRRAEEVSYDTDQGLAPSDAGRLTARGAGPDTALERKQQLDHLRGAFGGLSDAHHEILVMREFEGLSYREIGERLGLSRPSVESALFRARRRLSEEYEELETGAGCVRARSIVAQAADGALGARDRRRLGRHLSHCRPCRKDAYLAGLDPSELAVAPGVRARLAALLPLPAFLRRRDPADDGGLALAASSSPVAQWGATVAHYAEPGVAGWAKAAAAAVTLAAAGTGVGASVDQPLKLPGVPATILEQRAPAPKPAAEPVGRAAPASSAVAAPLGERVPRDARPTSPERPATPSRSQEASTVTAPPARPVLPAVPVPTEAVDGAAEALRGLIPGRAPANSRPRPASGLDRGATAVTEAVTKTGVPALALPDPAKLPERVVDEVGGVLQEADKAVSGILGG